MHDDTCDCQECCEHVETDHGICMDCGADRLEWLMAKAYDYFKGRDE
jgi:ribosomal protein L32